MDAPKLRQLWYIATREDLTLKLVKPNLGIPRLFPWRKGRAPKCDLELWAGRARDFEDSTVDLNQPSQILGLKKA